MKNDEYLNCFDIKEVIFDSNIDDWSIGTSIFDTIVNSKKQLLFLFETEYNYKIGCFIYSEITKYTFIKDPYAFLILIVLLVVCIIGIGNITMFVTLGYLLVSTLIYE